MTYFDLAALVAGKYRECAAANLFQVDRHQACL
jgi:hypothetical protein